MGQWALIAHGAHHVATQASDEACSWCASGVETAPMPAALRGSDGAVHLGYSGRSPGCAAYPRPSHFGLNERVLSSDAWMGSFVFSASVVVRLRLIISVLLSWMRLGAAGITGALSARAVDARCARFRILLALCLLLGQWFSVVHAARHDLGAPCASHASCAQCAPANAVGGTAATVALPLSCEPQALEPGTHNSARVPQSRVLRPQGRAPPSRPMT